MAQRVFKLVNDLNNPHLLKPHYFNDNGLFFVTRTYDEDYVIKLLFINKKYKRETNQTPREMHF